MSFEFNPDHLPGAHIVSVGQPAPRKEVILAEGNALPAGAVLGVLTANGKYTQFNPAGGDGSEDAAAILYASRDATLADKKVLVTVANSEVRGNALTWPDGITALQKAAAIAQLNAVGILVR